MKRNVLALLVVAALVPGVAAAAWTGSHTTANETYAIVDTAQTTCYDASRSITCPASGQPFFGQDAQLRGNQPSYTLSADGLTVYDNNTRLTWQRSPDTSGDGTITYSDKLTLAQAQDYPATLNAKNFGGFSDWRLPTIKELYSLMDFSGEEAIPGGSGTKPFLDTSYFTFSYGFTGSGERIIDSQWATSTLYVANSSQMFGVNFADGRIKGYGPWAGGTNSKVFFVICVRGNTDYGKNDYVDNGDGTITDNATGLMWSQADSGTGMDWQNALAWVQTQNAAKYLGHADWRLPNAKELQSIVDYARSPNTTQSAAINPVFSCTLITNENYQADYPWYWSGTTLGGMNGRDDGGVYIAFGRALGYVNGSWWDVHGAGAQRSDPKAAADLSRCTKQDNGYYDPRAPQGDAIRINNFVRLVRDAATPARQVLHLPAVARLRGLSATFTSRIEMLNTGSSAMTVDVRYTPRADVGGSPRTSTIALPPGQLLTIDDPLGAWFGFAAGENAVGSATFTVTSGPSGSLLVQSVITARNDDGSEYGQDLPAVRDADALQAGETAYLASLLDASRTRINCAAMALDDGTVLTVQPVDPIGFPLAAAKTLSLGAGASTQINDLNAGTDGFSLGQAADYLLEVKVASGRAAIYASVLDGTSTAPGTSDPTTILPVKAGAAKVTLLELGPIQGFNEFSGSAQISNLSPSSAEVTAEFYARGTAGVNATANLAIPAGETVGYEDIVGELFHTSGVGTVVLRATNGTSIMASGREFSVLRDAQGTINGTAGQLIPGMTDGQQLQPATTYHLLGLRQRAVGSALERSHLAVFNPSTEDASVTVTLFDGATGTSEGAARFSVGPGELVQWNSIIPAINPGQDGNTKRLEVTSDHAVFLKAFRVNAWGDPITIDALGP